MPIKYRGTSVWDEEDDKGVKYIQEIIAKGNEGGGFVSYSWPLPNSGQLEDKGVYAETDPYWGWVIGASTYLMDFNKPAQSILKITLIVIGLAIMVGILIIWQYASSMTKPINQAAQAMERFAEEIYLKKVWLYVQKMKLKTGKRHESNANKVEGYDS